MMNAPKLLALETGVPTQCYRQEEITEFFVELVTAQGSKRARAIRAAMRYAGVECRYSAIEPDYFIQPRSTQERNDRYMAEAMPLGERVIAAGLERAGVSPGDIDSFVVVSCTGFSVPGLDLLLAQRLGLPSHLARTQVWGMAAMAPSPPAAGARQRANAPRRAGAAAGPGTVHAASPV
ncbi:MAG: hypothetical protein IPK19_36045 [Chloroflexi bacterium]|nr:hypothetical protein [Chloroflexota bacterium]